MFTTNDYLWLMLLLLTSVTIGLLFTYIYVKHLYRGINHWIYGTIFSTLGFNFYVIGNIHSKFIIFFLGNLFVILGLFFFYHGTNSFIGYKSKNNDIKVLLFTGILALVYFYLVNYNVDMRRIIVAVITIYIMGKLIRNASISYQKGLAKFMIPILLVSAGIFLLQFSRVMGIVLGRSLNVIYMDLTYDSIIIYSTGILTILLSLFLTVAINFRAYHDLTSERHRLKNLSLTDYLTVLPNRRMLIQHLDNLTQSNTPFTIALFDLDEFKLINDRFGHDVGDEVIKSFANKIVLNIRKEDFICRYGGDEFIYVTLNSPESTIEKIKELKNKLTDENLLVNQYEFKIKTSIGLAHYPSDSKDSLDLIKKADEALYQVKLHNKGSMQFYSEIKNDNII